jgi:formylglycine-generating enzyme required for sulfatase activity
MKIRSNNNSPRKRAPFVPQRGLVLTAPWLLAAMGLISGLIPQHPAGAIDSGVELQRIEVIPMLKITGTIGTLFRIEYRTGLSSADDWLLLQNIVLPSSPYSFIDTNASGSPNRFYRVTTAPRAPQLVWINPGTFLLGSPEAEQDRLSDEGPQTRVTISKGFWIGKYEVSQAEYLSLISVNPSSFLGQLTSPVDTVSWPEATNYCAKLTVQERQAGRLPQGYAFRLPTEAEWEFAARAGTATRFSYGDDPGYVTLDAYAWFGSNSGEASHPVGTRLPNPSALHDVHGNVWEWCMDWYASAYPGGSITDPKGPATGAGRVIRGGSWKGLNRFCRSASRASSDPLIRNNYVGLRVVLAPTP